MKFWAWLVANGYLQDPTFRVRDLIEAYNHFCAQTDRIVLMEAWARRETSAVRQTQFLNALRDALGTVAIPLLATLPGVANTVINLDANAKRNAMIRFDADLSTLIQQSATIHLAAEERQIIPTFCTNLDRYLLELWPGRMTNNTPTTAQLANYLRTLRQQLHLFGVDHVFNTFNTNYTKKTETNNAVQAAIGTIVRPDTFAAWRAAQLARWNAIEACINFWETELPLARARAADIRAMLALGGAVYGDDLFRNVTQGEVDALVAHNGFRQHAGKLEREKWFYDQHAAPGGGVQHDFICTISLRTGAIAMLTGLAIARDDPAAMQHAVFTKPAEPHCYGIHEDALGAFNCLVRRVTVRNRVSGVVVRTIDFNTWNTGNLDLHFQMLEAAVTLMLQ